MIASDDPSPTAVVCPGAAGAGAASAAGAGACAAAAAASAAAAADAGAGAETVSMCGSRSIWINRSIGRLLHHYSEPAPSRTVHHAAPRRSVPWASFSKSMPNEPRRA